MTESTKTVVRYFVQIHTHTDGDFGYQNCPILEPLYEDEDERRCAIGDFATFKDAVAACKLQFQTMIDTLRTSDNSRQYFTDHFKRVLRTLDFVKERDYDSEDYRAMKPMEFDDDDMADVDYFGCINWNGGNQHGYVLIARHTHENAVAVIRDSMAKADELYSNLRDLGGSCRIKLGF